MSTPTGLDALSRQRGAEPPAAGAVNSSAIPLPARRWRTRVLLPASVVIASAGLLAWSGRAALSPAIAVRVVPVVVRTDSTGGGAVAVQASGWVEPDPAAIGVAALADGVVKDVRAFDGAAVKAGDILATLVDDDARLLLARADADVAERDAALHLAQAELDAAQRGWDHPTELQRRVATTEAMLAERRGELARWPSDLAAEKARADELRAEFDRLQELHKAAQASEIEFIRAQKQLERQAAVVAATETRKGVLEAQVAGMEAELRAAKENLELRIPERRMLETTKASAARAAAALELARAAQAEARLRLERMSVRAPCDGVVLRRETEPGSKVVLNTDDPHSAHIMHLYDPRKLQVRVDVPLAEAAAVAVGQAAEIVVNVLPDRVFHGRLTRVVHEADLQKNTLQVKAAIEDPSPQIKPEMLARVRFIGAAASAPASPTGVLLAPRKLIRSEGGSAAAGTTWIVDAGGRARLRRVTLGARQAEDWIEVREGLAAGDRLIAAAPDGLDDGARVRIVAEADE